MSPRHYTSPPSFPRLRYTTPIGLRRRHLPNRLTLGEMIRERLARTVTPETMVRLRLVGPLSMEQYHQLMIRDVVAYGQQKAFSFDLDTSGLSLLTGYSEPLNELAGPGPISPLREVETLREERLAGIAEAETARVEEEHAAARLLIDRLRAARDWEAGR